jgi:hypothetical protein
MGKRAKAGGRLQIHRETLRSLAAESLERVAGGMDPNPRTNAWTGRGGDEGALDPIEVCR